MERTLNGTDLKKKRLTTIIYDSDLNLPDNQRETLGKKYSEVETDYLYYKDIAERAEKILTIAKNGHDSLWQKAKKIFNF